MGWTLKEFEAFINKAETDTAFEAFTKRKRAMQDGMLPTTFSAEKRSATEDLDASRKRPRTSTNGGYDTDVNYNSSVGSTYGSYTADAPAMGLYSAVKVPASFGSTFLGGLASEQQSTNTFMPPGTSTSSSSTGLGFAASSNGRPSFPASYASGTNAASQPSSNSTSIQNIPYMPVSNGASSTPSQSSPRAAAVDDNNILEDPKAQEARKLVGSVGLVPHRFIVG